MKTGASPRSTLLVRPAVVTRGGPVLMLHVGLDLSRTRVDVHVMNEAGAPMLVTTAAPDAGGLASLAARIGAFEQPVTAAEGALRRPGAQHPDVPPLGTLAGIGPAPGDTIAAEVGEI